MKSNKAIVKVMHPKPEEPSIAPLIKEVLGRLGEDPRREGLMRFVAPSLIDSIAVEMVSG